MNEDKVKSCPLCKGEPIIEVINPHSHIFANFMPDFKGEAFISCKECGCAISGNNITEVVEKWNKRKPINNIIDDLESKLKEVDKHAINDLCKFGEYYATTRAIKIVKECAE